MADKGEYIPLRLLEYRDVLFAYILTQVREWDTAEDLFQEVSLTILRKAQEGVEVEHFKAWSREIARRTVLDYWKRKGGQAKALSHDALLALDQAFVLREASQTGHEQEQLALLEKCLKKMPERLMHMINLRYQEDLSLSAVAERAHSTVNAVQVALSRARAFLAECIRRQAVEISEPLLPNDLTEDAIS